MHFLDSNVFKLLGHDSVIKYPDSVNNILENK